MKEFLRSVAEHYFAPIAAKPSAEQDWLAVTDYLFVFPSRRAGLFFAQYLHDVRNGGEGGAKGSIPVFSPQMITIGDLFDCFSNARVADHTQLLFELYKIYNEVLADEVKRRQEQGEEPLGFKQESFDDFVFWGEMLLNDFADVDRYLADARQLFHNVRDIKEIEASMGGPLAGLAPEVIQAIQSFWGNVYYGEKNGNAKSSFQQTWSILYEVYSRFREALRAKGLAYDGMRQRDVVEAIPGGDLDVFLDNLPKHIVFVGITAINEAERKLMRWLRDARGAEFCWDYADAHLKPAAIQQGGEPQAHASYFTRRNLEDFPNAMSNLELDAYLVPDKEREVVRVPVPSAVGQTSMAAKILEQWGTQDAMHTAVVLADENLLVPMCYAIPEQFGTFNVTMGYSLRSTQTFALVEALAELQNNYRASSQTFYYKPVLQVLGHSFVMSIEPNLAPQLSLKILHDGMYQIPADMLQKDSALMRLLFSPAQSLEQSKEYLSAIFDKLLEYEATKEEETPGIGDLERESLLCYIDQLEQLVAQIQDSGVQGLTRYSLIHLLQRLVGSQRVSFSGEPLSGLQVMGILETRALDFERIVMLSMNEGVFPAKPSQNTFIPAALRSAFGLPTQRHKDSVIAYHFYRLLSRAKKVSMLFDSRGGMKSGEESRYLLQLQYLNQCEVTTIVPQSAITTEESNEIVVEKNAEVMGKLELFKKGGDRKLSASSLKQYLTCPLMFYLSTVERLRENDEIADEVADTQFGDILHHAMEYIYKEACGKQLLSDNIKGMQHADNVERCVTKAFEEVMPHAERTGYIELILGMVKQYVNGILEHDAKLVPLTYLASEGKQTVCYAVDENLAVNLTAVYDRLDIVIDRESGICTLRVVDYKTGSPSNKLAIEQLEDLSSGKFSKEAFQVLFYCLMLNYATDDTLRAFNLKPARPENAYQRVQPHLYFTRNFAQREEAVKSCLKSNKQDIECFDEVRETFETSLKKVLQEIFDPNVPFTQCEPAKCSQYCAFKEVCGRN